MEITIIIPTYNRLELLKKVLIAYNNQTYDLKKIEVIVYDDCSQISPEKEIRKIKKKYKFRFYRGNKNCGQGEVRNKVIKLAKGKYILFTGDDMIPEPNLLEEHMALHKKYNGIAVLGRIFWTKEIRNKFMNFIEGIQFHYSNIKDRNNAKFHFYTSNISLEKSWFNNEEYSKEFKNYGLEDIEIGYRLEKKGLRIVYNPKAVVYHDHSYNFEQFCNRMKNVGKSAVIFARLHPELKRKYLFFFPLDYILRFGSFLLSRKFIERINQKVYWYSNFVYWYFKGIDEGLKEENMF